MKRRSRTFWAVALAVSVLLAGLSVSLLAVLLTSTPTPVVTPLYPAPPDPATVPVQHIVIVVMENHAFDNYFGAYCPQSGPYCPETANGIQPGACVALHPLLPASGCVTPYPFLNNQSNLSTPDIQHDWQPSHIAYDNGAMDGFYTAEGFTTEPFGYYTANEIPEYYGLAEQYALGDNFFSGVLSYSLPNHWYILAGQAPPTSVYFTLPGTGTHHLGANERAYLNQANATHTVVDLLARSSATWKYYDFPLPTYSSALATHRAFNYWNPLAGKAASYTANTSAHLVNVSAFYNDTARGTLPNISWVIPSVPESDHPPANLRTGQDWISTLVGDVEHSPQWNSTAVFVTWDEYGGFYDHVAPPVVDQFGPSFRVPLLVISPYTPPESIPHEFGDFESLLRLVEWRYALGSLGTHDVGAPLLLNYFDFAATPRPPLPTTNYSNYPVPLQSLPPPNPIGRPSVVAGPGSLTLRWSTPVGGGAVSGYAVNIRGSGAFDFSTVLGGSANGIQMTGLAGGSAYSVSVTAFSGSLSASPVSVGATTSRILGGGSTLGAEVLASGSTIAFIGIAIWVGRRCRRDRPPNLEARAAVTPVGRPSPSNLKTLESDGPDARIAPSPDGRTGPTPDGET